MIIEIEGQRVEVDDGFAKLPPDQQSATVDEIAERLGAQPTPPQRESEQSKAVRNDLAAASNDFFTKNSSPVDSFMRGAADTVSFGLADEAAALGARYNPLDPENYSSVSDAAQTLANLNPVTNVINQARQLVSPDGRLRRERAFQAQREDADPNAMLAGRVTGGLLGAGALMKANAPFMATLPADASLAAKALQGAKAGALYSGLYGAGSGEDLTDRAEQATTGALTGAAIGGAIPVITEGIKAVAKPVTDAIKGYWKPEAFANQKIAERLANANIDPLQAAAKMERQPGTSMVDVGGKSAKNLLRAATNVPGGAEDFVVAKLNKRQWSQGDRVKDIIRETFADPEKFEVAKSRLFEIQAQTSKPAYEKAMAKKGVWNNRLDMFLKDPVTQSGIKQGMRIQRMEALAENKPFNPKDFAIIGFNEAGDPIIDGVPNMRTINVIKKGLDAMLEGARHPITGRLTEEGRAIDQVRRAFLSEVDKVNPAYAAARKTYADFMQVNEAMEFGRDALKLSPASVKARVDAMNPMERIAARVGAAESLRKAVDEAGWTNNAILKLFSSRQKVGNLKELFRSKEEWAEARKMVFAEMRKRATYDTVKGNSTTAKQLAEMMDSGGLRDGVDLVQGVVTGGPVSATLRYIGSRMKMLGGFTPEVADQVARKLMATDPETVRKITSDLMKIEAQKISADQKRQLIQRIITPVLAIEAQRLPAQ